MSSTVIHLALCANERYFPGLFCAVGSALASLGPLFCAEVHIIDAGLSGKNREALRELGARSGGHSIRFIEPASELFQGIKTSNYHISSYYRLAFPVLLEVERVIYLDADLLVFGCLGSLWKNTDGSPMPIAAVQDWETPTIAADSQRLARQLEASAAMGYFNAGMMVLDLSELRQADFTKRVCQILIENGHLVRFADQTASNAFCAGRWLMLDSAWNMPAWAFDQQAGNALPQVLHHTNSAPWLRRRYCPSQALFERVAKELALELPEPEVPLLHSCLHALSQWCLAPFRFSYQGIRAILAGALRDHARCRERLGISLYWWRYFWGGPCRVVRYRRRIREIRKSATGWQSTFPA